MAAAFNRRGRSRSRRFLSSNSSRRRRGFGCFYAGVGSASFSRWGIATTVSARAAVAVAVEELVGAASAPIRQVPSSKRRRGHKKNEIREVASSSRKDSG